MRILKLVGIVTLAVAVAACATASAETTSSAPEVAGFWWGLWNGFTCGFAFIGSLFNPEIAIYQTPNNGGWYDFGFVLGVGSLFGGASRA